MSGGESSQPKDQSVLPPGTILIENISVSELQEQVQQHNTVVQQLKNLLRENEKLYQEKIKESEDIAVKFQKFKLQSKAKICQLSNQLRGFEKASKKEDGEVEDTSSSDSSDQSKRGKVILLRKQLEQARHQVEKQNKEMQDISEKFDTVVNDLQVQLTEKNRLILTLTEPEAEISAPSGKDNVSFPKMETNIQEMYAQMVYKDSKILELNNHILEHERKIMDLQEHIKEKEEVLQSRNRAIQLMSEDMTRKGKSVMDELHETREQMRIMQENFALVETVWKKEKNDLNLEIERINEKFDRDTTERDHKIEDLEDSLKKLECIRYDLTTKNAELQKKLVLTQENADKRCESYQNKVQGELENLKQCFKKEQMQVFELQKLLEDSSNQSEVKVLKARVKERTKFKALDRELSALKDENGQTVEKVTQLQHIIAELEEEKGTLQLKLMEIEEQIISQEKLKIDFVELEKTLAETLVKHSELEKHCIELNCLNNNLQQKFENLDGNFKKLSDQHKLVSRRNEHLNEQTSEMRVVQNDLENVKVCLEEEINKHIEENKSLLDSCSLLRDEKVSLEMKIIELEEMKEGEDRRKKDLFSKIDQLQNSLEKEKGPSLDLERENIEIKGQMHVLTMSEASMCERLKNVLEELEETKSRCSSVVKETECLKEENGKLIQDLKDSQVMLQKLKISEREIHSTLAEKDVVIHELRGRCHLMDIHSNEILNSCGVNSFQNLIDKFQNLSKDIEEWKLKVKEKDNELEMLKFNIQSNLDLNKQLSLKIQEKEDEVKAIYQKMFNVEQRFEEHKINFKDEKDKLNMIIQQYVEEKRELVTVIKEKESFIENFNLNSKENAENIQTLGKNVNNQTERVIYLEHQNEALNVEISSLKKAKHTESEKSHSNISSLLSQINDLETEVCELQSTISEKENSKKKIESEYNELKFSYAKLCENHSILQNSHSIQIEEQNRIVDGLQKQLDVLTQEVTSKDTELNSVFKDLGDKHREVKELQSSVLVFEGKLQDVLSEREELLKQVSFKDLKIMKFTKDIEQLQLQVNIETKKFVNIVKKYEDITEKNTLISNELHETQNNVIILEKKIANFSTIMSEKDDLCKKNLSEKLLLEKEVEKLKEENQYSLQLLIQIREEKELLNSQYAEIFSELSSKSTDLNMTTKELEAVKETFSEVVNVKEEYHDKVVRLERECAALKFENEKLENKYSNVILMSEELKQKNTALWDSEKLLKKESEHLIDINNEYKTKIVDLSNSLKDLESESKIMKTLKQSAENESKHQLELLRGEVRILSEEKEKLVDSKVKQREHLEQIHLLEEETVMQKNTINSMTEEINKYSSLTSKLQFEVNDLKENLSKSRDELSHRLQDLMEQNVALDKANTELILQLHMIEVEKMNLFDEIGAVRILCNQQEEKNQLLTSMINENVQNHQTNQNMMVSQIKEYEQIIEKCQMDLGILGSIKEKNQVLCCKLKHLSNFVKIEEGESIPETDGEFEESFCVNEMFESIQNQFALKNQEVEKLQFDLNRLLCEKTSLENSNRSFVEENSSLLTTIKSLVQEKSDLSITIHDFVKVLFDFSHMHDSKFVEIIDDLHLKGNALKNVEVKVALCKTHILQKYDIFQSEVKGLVEKVQNCEEKICSLHCSNNKLIKEKQTCDDLCKDLQLQIEKSSEHIAVLKSDSSCHAQNLSSEIEASQLEIQDLKRQLNMEIKKFQLLDERLQDTDKENSELLEKKNIAEENVNSLKDELGEKNRVLDKYLNEFQHSQEKIVKFKNFVYDLGAECSDLQNNDDFSIDELSSFEEVFDILLHKVKDKNTTINQLNSELQRLMEEMSAQSSFLHASESTIKQLEKEIATLQERKYTLEKELNTLEMELDKKNKKLYDQENKLQLFMDVQLKLKKNMCHLQEEYSDFQGGKNFNSNQLSSFEEMLNTLLHSVEEKNVVINRLKKEVLDASEKISVLNSSLQLSESANKSLENKVLEITAEKFNYVESLKLLHIDLSNTEEHNLSLKQNIDSLKQQLLAIEEECGLYKNELLITQGKTLDLGDSNKNMLQIINEKDTLLKNREAEFNQLNEKERMKNELLALELNSLQQEMKNAHALNSEEKLQELEKLYNESQSLSSHYSSAVSIAEHLNQMLQVKLSSNSMSHLIQEKGDKDVFSFLALQVSLLVNLMQEKDNELQKLSCDIQHLLYEKNRSVESLSAKSDECKTLSEETNKLKELLSSLRKESNPGKHEMVNIPSILHGIKNTVGTEIVERNVSTHKEALQRESASVYNFKESNDDSKSENNSLRHELNISKVKSVKMLTKLKISKDKIERLQTEITDLTFANEKLISDHKESLLFQEQQEIQFRNLQKECQNLRHEKVLEVSRFNDIVSELKTRVAATDNSNIEVRTELQHYKEMWEQCNSTFELQREDNAQLSRKLNDAALEIECLKSNAFDLESKCNLIENDKLHLLKEVKNLKEHIEMLVSDNDTFQTIIEKLKSSKCAVDQDISKQKENYLKEINDLKKVYEYELSDLRNIIKSGEESKALVLNLESNCTQLKNECNFLTASNKILETKIQEIIENKKSCERKNEELQLELLKQQELLQTLQVSHSGRWHETDINCSGKGEKIDQEQSSGIGIASSKDLEKCESKASIDMVDHEEKSILGLKLQNVMKEKIDLQLDLKDLTEKFGYGVFENEIYKCNDGKDKIVIDEHLKQESLIKQQVSKPLAQEQTISPGVISYTDLDSLQQVLPTTEMCAKCIPLERELQQAISSLHCQGLRCEELSLEVSKLLEERNILRLKITQHLHYSQQKQGVFLNTSPESPMLISDDLISVKVENPNDELKLDPSYTGYIKYSDYCAEIDELHKRLDQSEKICSELRRVNEALDSALISEQEQRKLVEDELGYAKENLKLDSKAPKDEYQLLLEDYEDSDICIGTDLSISHRVKSQAYQFQRWLRGRRTYLQRTVRSGNYKQIICIIYVFVIHLWLCMNIFKSC